VNGTQTTPAPASRWVFALSQIGLVRFTALISLGAAIYWGLLASDRYVSEAHVIVQQTEMAGMASLDMASLLGAPGTNNRSDQMLLRDYLLSIDMLKKLDVSLKISAHYADSKNDLLSRMWFRNPPIEWLHRHFLSRTSVEFDDYAGVLMIRSEAYDPPMSKAIVQMMVAEGEAFMDEVARNLAREQVTFLEKQVRQNAERANAARQIVLAFQDKKGIASPESMAESLMTIIGQLEGRRAVLQTERNSLRAYLVPNHPNIVLIEQQLTAIEKQIAGEQAKLAAPGGKPLNRTVEELQRLKVEAEFQQKVYESSLVALEKGRVEATRTLKKMSVLQSPHLPEYPLQPRRIYNVIVFVLLAFLLAGVLKLLMAAIRDHQD
jgi:capsular polysaccharide transport system permease protein